MRSKLLQRVFQEFNALLINMSNGESNKYLSSSHTLIIAMFKSENKYEVSKYLGVSKLSNQISLRLIKFLFKSIIPPFSMDFKKKYQQQPQFCNEDILFH